MRYKGARQPLPEIAQALNVDAIVEGTVLRSNGRVRISTQLIHAASDTHLWSKQYESDLRDVLALQSDVARAIADEIQVQLSPQQKSRLAGSRPVDPVAYESFLKGRHFWYRRSPDALKKAVEYLQQAIDLDPSHALAHAGLADAYVSLGWDLFGLSSPADNYPKAKRAAQRALEIDPNCAEAHAALGCVAAQFDWDWTTAEAGISARHRTQTPVRPGAHLVLAFPEGHGPHRGLAGREPPSPRMRSTRARAQHAHGLASALLEAARQSHRAVPEDTRARRDVHPGARVPGSGVPSRRVRSRAPFPNSRGPSSYPSATRPTWRTWVMDTPWRAGERTRSGFSTN